MVLPKISDFDLQGKRVIARLDLYIPDNDSSRLETSKKTLDYLIKNKAKIIIIGHKGRPGGIQDKSLSLRNLTQPLGALVHKDVVFVEDFMNFDFKQGEIFLFENLRFDKGEEENDPEFAKRLASMGEIYVNEAFAVSHRAHASIVSIPKFLPHTTGFRFVKEIEYLNRVIENPERPLLVLISGIKKDKLEMIEPLAKIFDKVLVAGRLPEYLEISNNEKIIIADLNPDKEDIAVHSIGRFEKEIEKARTIVLAGVIGKYEDEDHRLGTRRVFEAVANATAYKVAGGGDTEAALTMFNLTDKFDWISVGGGAMLEFLAKGSLPGIEALLE